MQQSATESSSWEQTQDLSALPEATREMYGRVAEINKRLKDLKVSMPVLSLVAFLLLFLFFPSYSLLLFLPLHPFC